MGKSRFASGDERNFGSSAAHETGPLPLLPSGPGGVHGESLHRARSSTHRQAREIFSRLPASRSLAQRVCLRKLRPKANGFVRSPPPRRGSCRVKDLRSSWDLRPHNFVIPNPAPTLLVGAGREESAISRAPFVAQPFVAVCFCLHTNAALRRIFAAQCSRVQVLNSLNRSIDCCEYCPTSMM